MKRCLSLLVLLSMLAGCGSQSVDAQKIEKTVYAMDTVMTMTAYPAEGQTEDDVSAALNAAQGEIQRLDALLSVSNEQGEIGGLNSGERTRLSDETGRLLQPLRQIRAGPLIPRSIRWQCYGASPPGHIMCRRSRSWIRCSGLWGIYRPR